MARYNLTELETAAMAAGPSAADLYFRLGLIYSTGEELDRVAAHKWFNLAAMNGNRDAIRLRREIAEMMSDVEIATAQRDARAWIAAH